MDLMTAPLSERLNPGPWSQWNGTKEEWQDRFWLFIDAHELERERFFMRERLQEPTYEFFASDNQARIAWHIYQKILSRNSPFPPDGQERRDRRRQNEHIRRYRESRTPKGITDSFSGEIS